MSRPILHEPHKCRREEIWKPTTEGSRTSRPRRILKEGFSENAQCLFGEIRRRCSCEGRQVERMRAGILATNRGTPRIGTTRSTQRRIVRYSPHTPSDRNARSDECQIQIVRAQAAAEKLGGRQRRSQNSDRRLARTRSNEAGYLSGCKRRVTWLL